MENMPLTPLSPYPTASQDTSNGGILAEVMDVINPLQHIPFVSQVYRSITGDPISAGAKILGGGLFGGVIGAASSAVTAMVEGVSGEPLVTTASSFIKGIGEGQGEASSYAASTTATALQSDNGQALVNMVQEGVFTEDHVIAPDPAAANAVLASTTPLRDFREARPLGVSDDTIQQQLNASLFVGAKDLIK